MPSLNSSLWIICKRSVKVADKLRFKNKNLCSEFKKMDSLIILDKFGNKKNSEISERMCEVVNEAEEIQRFLVVRNNLAKETFSHSEWPYP